MSVAAELSLGSPHTTGIPKTACEVTEAPIQSQLSKVKKMCGLVEQTVISLGENLEPVLSVAENKEPEHTEAACTQAGASPLEQQLAAMESVLLGTQARLTAIGARLAV